MQLNVDVHQSTPPNAGSAEASRGWIFGLVAPDDSQLAMPQALPYSFEADCECPDDCLRDHENE